MPNMPDRRMQAYCADIVGKSGPVRMPDSP